MTEYVTSCVNINVLLTCSDMFMMLSIDLIDNVEKLMLTSEMICLLGSNACHILIYTE